MHRSLQGSVFQAKRISRDLEVWKAGVPEEVGRGLDCPELRESWKRRYECCGPAPAQAGFVARASSLDFV